MALFAVPVEFEGKTLRDLRQQRSDPWRSDIIAKYLGINEDTPLRAGMTAELPPENSTEYQFLQRNFKETTQDQLFAEQYTKALQDKLDKETKWVDQYTKENPFVFDEQLAKQSATAEYEPYYGELLKDYLVDVGQQRATVQDEKKLLGTLRQLDVGQRSRAYQYAVENAQEGYEGKGLFSSGMRARDVGKQNIEYKTGLEGATAQYQTQEAGLERQLTGYQTEEERKRRDIGRAQEVAVAGGIETRRGEALKPYTYAYEQAYKRQFHPEQMTATDYLPPDYLRY